MSTHYDTLHVDPGAAHDEIRRAYHQEARRWHPDGFVDRTPQEAEAAADSMRQVNEAWRVLGDADRRREYDRSLRPGARHDRTVITDDHGVTRVDPRLLDPEFLAARRRAQEADVDTGHGAALRVIPVLAFFFLIAAIFIFTAYARGSSATSSDDSVPGPQIGVDAGECVRILTGPQLISVPCTGLYDGRVIGAYEPGGSCPALTVREVTLSNGVTACLGV